MNSRFSQSARMIAIGMVAAQYVEYSSAKSLTYFNP